MTSLRAENPVLTRGGLEILASESSGPGVLAYRREHGGDAAIVLLNSADHSTLAHRIDVGAAPHHRLEVLFSEPATEALTTDAPGTDAAITDVATTSAATTDSATTDAADTDAATIDATTIDAAITDAEGG